MSVAWQYQRFVVHVKEESPLKAKKKKIQSEFDMALFYYFIIICHIL